MPDSPIAATTLILDYLIRIEATVVQLQQELHTHIAASVAERRAVQEAVAQTVRTESQRLAAELAQLRVQIGRLTVRITALEAAVQADSFAGLEREQAA